MTHITRKVNAETIFTQFCIEIYKSISIARLYYSMIVAVPTIKIIS
jgi:hypothetical protein